MTTIKADLYDSAGKALDGAIRVTLDYQLGNTGTGKVYMSTPVTVPLVAGKAFLELEQSEGAKVSYLFEILQNQQITETSEDGTTTTKTILVQVGDPFHAVVPNSSVPLNLTDLMPTGITRDALAAAIVTITRRLYNEPAFWQALQQQLFSYKGEYDSSFQYRLGDIVGYGGSSFLCRSPLPIAGVVPEKTSSFWQLLAERGATGSGTTGLDIPYSATTWDSSLNAPSQNAVRDIIETLAKKTDIPNLSTFAPLVSPSFTGLPSVPSPPKGDSSGRIASTGWVQAEIAPLIGGGSSTIPIGTIIAFAGTSIPSKWLRCDGRMIDRSQYALLYTAIGTTYGAIDPDYASYFKLPDLRGRTVVGRNISEVNTSAPTNYIVASWATTNGGVGGAESVALATTNIPAHNHIVEFCLMYSSPVANNPTPVKAGYTNGYQDLYLYAYSNGQVQTYYSDAYGYWHRSVNNQFVRTLDVGTGAAHNNVQPSMALNYIIYAGA